MKNKFLKLFATIFGLLLISSCSYTLDRLKNVGRPPEFAQIKVPQVEAEQGSDNSITQDHKENIRKTNSLWKPGSSTTFFRDNRSWRVGDILKVSVKIQDNATLNNKTTNDKKDSSKTLLGTFFGKERAIRSVLSASKNSTGDLANFGSNSGFQGSGGISRKEDINIEIAAIVSQILPNGNMVIRGHQEIRVNFELREISIAGIVRPRDIDANNSVSSDKVAEARISYGGRGINTDVQKPGAVNEVVNIISPF